MSSSYLRGIPLDKPGKCLGNARGSVALYVYRVENIQKNISTSKERGGIVDCRYLIMNLVFVSKIWIFCSNYE